MPRTGPSIVAYAVLPAVLVLACVDAFAQTLPELQWPTEVSAEPPPLWMPGNKANMPVPSIAAQGVDDAAYQLGICYLNSGMPIAALDAMQGTDSANDDIRFAKELAIGAAFGQLNLLAQARSQYCYVLQNSKNEYQRQLARQYLSEVDIALNSREYLRGSGGVSFRYDTDPGVLPTFNAVGIPFHAPASFADQYNANVGYDLWRTDNTDLTAGYSLFGTNNYNPVSKNYNITQNDFFLLYRVRGYFGYTPMYAGFYVDYQYTTVGGQGFLSRPLINPYVTFLHDDRWSSLLYAEYGAFNYLSPFNPGGSALDLNSRQGRFGITARRRVGAARNMQLSGGYQFQVNNSDGSDYDFTGQSVLANMLWNVRGDGMQLSLTAQYIFRNYSNIDSVGDIRRLDNEFAAYGTLLYPFTKKLYGVWVAGVDDNGSTVSVNRYHRFWTTLGIEYYFPGSWSQRMRQIY